LDFDDEEEMDGSVDFFPTTRCKDPFNTEPFIDNNVNNVDPFSDYSIDAHPFATTAQPTTEEIFFEPIDNDNSFLSALESPSNYYSNHHDHRQQESVDHQRERIELEHRRLAFIRLFLRSDMVYTSPLTRAVQTALMAMYGHNAFVKSNLCFYRYCW